MAFHLTNGAYSKMLIKHASRRCTAAAEFNLSSHPQGERTLSQSEHPLSDGVPLSQAHQRRLKSSGTLNENTVLLAILTLSENIMKIKVYLSISILGIVVSITSLLIPSFLFKSPQSA